MIGESLVGKGSDVTRIVPWEKSTFEEGSWTNNDLRVWPQSVSGCTITRSPKVSHRPNTRPLHVMIRNAKTHEGEGSYIALGVGIRARESDRDFKIPAAEAELVPTLQHATLVLKSM